MSNNVYHHRMWGQADIVFTSFLLWSFFFILKEKPFWAIIFFSISFAFKMQAMFFLPIFIILLLRRKFPFYLFFMIPFVYFVSIVPAWFMAGGPLEKLLTIYFSQFNTFHSLSMRAPNLYLFIDAENSFDLIVRIGMVVTFLLVLAYLALRVTKYKDLSMSSLCIDSAMLTFFIPFLLPKMHDRYFFAGGVFLAILAILNNRFIWAAVLSQVTSIISFIPYFTGWSDLFAKIGAGLNVFLIAGLIYYFIDYHERLLLQDKTNLRTQVS